MLFMTIICLNVLIHCNVGKSLGKPSCKKSEVFLNIVQKAFDPPPFYLNICPILQGVFFVEAGTSNVF